MNEYQIRLQQFLKATGESDSSLEDKCELGRSTINKIFTGETKRLSSKTIDKILQSYPWLSIEWLQTGRGSMKISSSDSDIEQNPIFIAVKKEKDELKAKYYSLLEKYNDCLEGRISLR